MLSGEQAQKELEKFRSSERNLSKLVRVRKTLAPRLAYEVVAVLADDRKDWRPVALQLEALDDSKLAKVLGAIAPELGKDLARWWRWSASQPYQRGWMRRAYRSSDPRTSLASRWTELRELLRHAAYYPQPLRWHAEWALYLPYQVPLGPLLASAITAGDTDVARVLVESIRGGHRIGGPSHHAYVALLASSDQGSWSEVERLLVAAERSEGLRQTILEASDLAHPDAFARILDVVVEHRLARFASTVRALGVWVGEDLTVRQEKQVADAVARLADHLRRPRSAAELAASDPVDAFLGTWALGVRDVAVATPAAEMLLGSDDQRTRLASARLLADFEVATSGPGLARAVQDPSLPVFAAALAAWPAQVHMYGRRSVPLTEPVRRTLLERVAAGSKVQEVETGIIGRLPRKTGSPLVADVLVCYSEDRPLDPALVAAASADGRWIAARRWAETPGEHRVVLFGLLADRSTNVRDVVAGALLSLPSISEQEARTVESALARKSADLRTTCLTLLRKQPPSAVDASVVRLRAGNAEQQRAAEELSPTLSAGAAVEADPTGPLRFTVEERTPAQRPTAPDLTYWTRYHAGLQLAFRSLGAWLDEHADVEVQSYGGVELLANIRWIHAGKDGELPIPEVLGPWWERTAPSLTDGGVEVALLSLVPRVNRPWVTNVVRQVLGPVVDELPRIDVNSLRWQAFSALAVHGRRGSWNEPVLSFLEAAAAALPLDGLRGPAEVLKRRGRTLQVDQWGNASRSDDRDPFGALFRGAPSLVDPATLTDAQLTRLWRALRFIDEPEGTFDRWSGPTVEVQATNMYGSAHGSMRVYDQPDRWYPSSRLLAEAFDRGAATRADVIDALVLVPRPAYWWADRQDALRTFTGLRPESWASSPALQAVVAEVRDAVVAAEVARGDLPTPLSPTAHGLRTVYGASHLVDCVAALGTRPFTRAYAWTQSRESSLSHLIRVNQPAPHDSAEVLSRLCREARISDRRLIETAVYAPQWSKLIEQHLGWQGLESAVWWVHAHTKDPGWSVDPEIRTQWASEVSQRTPLDAAELVDGAADVAWFVAVVETLGDERFDAVLDAAKYASSAGGHKRAQLFATALRGRVTEEELVQRIQGKRHQDSVRALGLLPLHEESDLYRRYELLRGFVATDRTSGSQRRASESTAVEIGLENLARTASFRDPQRLVWAMEAQAVRDLAAGPITAVDGDLVVTLSLDAAGAPQLEVARAGKPLKSLPAKSDKVPEIAALRDRAASLKKQSRRMRSSLEAACVLGDAFEGDELATLLAHPVLSPMLRDLVLVDSEGRVGFPDSGDRLVSADGEEVAISGSVRVAHPVDLLASGQWPDLQHAVMRDGRRQPFKQLFRELYTLNANERDEQGVSSRRYAGHQLESRRAAGLFTSRGWVADFEQGFSRTFHQQRITAWCRVVNGWGSPTEVEDATVDDVTFHPAGDWLPLQLADVPPRLFSETMRDLDLVVSVAHAGGVDPAASESSVEMRGRLVDETADMLALCNVEVSGHHVRVKGALGTYSVHLGSGVVHRIPGNAVCIVPVSAQHRGRIFLPFADDDPRTAEIVAKVVLLARDDKIKDPTILQQLVR